jgi:hypothetical protein
MIVEGPGLATPGRHQFLVSNSSDPTDAGAWTGLDTAEFWVDQLAGGQVGACPSLRFDAASGFYYVLTGGADILLLRSQTLARGTWELANVTGGAIISPDAGDCAAAGAPWGGWFTPSPRAAALLANCTAGVPPFNKGRGFGDASDVDLSEVLVGARECAGLAASGPGRPSALGRHAGLAALCARVAATGEEQVATLFQYGGGDQKTFGFSNLAIAPGRMFDVLGSFFP